MTSKILGGGKLPWMSPFINVGEICPPCPIGIDAHDCWIWHQVIYQSLSSISDVIKKPHFVRLSFCLFVRQYFLYLYYTIQCILVLGTGTRVPVTRVPGRYPVSLNTCVIFFTKLGTLYFWAITLTQQQLMHCTCILKWDCKDGGSIYRPGVAARASQEYAVGWVSFEVALRWCRSSRMSDSQCGHNIRWARAIKMSFKR